MDIKRATIDNVSDISNIEINCFSTPWSKENIYNELNRKGTVAFLAWEKDVATGYVLMNIIANEGYMCNIAVLYKYRNKGVGKALLESIIDVAVNENLAFVTLEVRKSNKIAIKMYEKAGFIFVGERKDYYHNPKESAVLMTKFFNEAT
ncbi:MAG: ribosomal protein S18-alanine N-acetyltransferase [Acutalibacteraceae bacterium]